MMDNVFSTSTMNEIAESIAETIRKRTRQGKGISSKDENSKLTTLKKLSPDYIDIRKKYNAELHSQTNPRKSNLTATGQLLDSIEGKGEKNKITIEINDERGPGIDGRKSNVGNNKLRKFVEEKGRIFFGLSKSERNAIKRDLRNRIKQAVKNI